MGNRMGMMPAGSMPNGAASYPVASPYPGGVSPTGMMGPSGYATAPSGDFSPARPVTGTMGFGTSMPTGAQ
ncbi:MAG: hypothetical protein IT423_15605 [Pirellulaceae bacterium]|nr:hypothetical protein [Pirellulaceae bacterium]